MELKHIDSFIYTKITQYRLNSKVIKTDNKFIMYNNFKSCKIAYKNLLKSIKIIIVKFNSIF